MKIEHPTLDLMVFTFKKGISAAWSKMRWKEDHAHGLFKPCPCEETRKVREGLFSVFKVLGYLFRVSNSGKGGEKGEQRVESREGSE